MKKNLLIILFALLSNFTSNAQITSIRPNHAVQGQSLMTTITLSDGVMQNSTPPNNNLGIYLQNGGTTIYATNAYSPFASFYYLNNSGTVTWYDSTRAPFNIPANTPSGYYDVVLVSYVLPLLTPDTNRLYNGFFVEHPTGTIEGSVYFDFNQNGIKDPNDVPMQNTRVQFSPTNDFAFTNAQGKFSYVVDTGTYVTDCIVPGTFTQTSLPLTYTASIPPSAFNQDFGIYSSAYAYSHDSYLGWARFRCSSVNQLSVTIANRGYFPVQDKVTLIVSSNLVLSSATTPPDFINGDTLTWIIPSLAPSTTILVGGSLLFIAPAAGQTISYQMIDSVFDMSGTFIDANVDQYSYIVRCSYDPNDKNVMPTGVLAQHYTPINSELTYLVNFQNTGNDYAYDVYIYDTLDANLDLSTFEVIESSHEVNTQMTATGAVRFNFFNIMLPDSGLDEAGSHGWVRYKIRPNAGLPDPTEITNTSYIVFDFNYPIITNTTLNTLTALQYPQSDFTTSDVTICETNCIIFNNQSTSGTNYEWFFQGGSPSTSTSANPGAICYSVSGSYDVTLITTNALGSDTLTQLAYINVATSPGIFTVSQVADSLIAPQGFDSYQWYYNNVLISGATSYFYVATQNGDYGIVVSNANGCQSGVNIPNFSIGIDDISSEKGISIYPNPTSGQFELSFSSNDNQNVTIAIFDKVGQMVQSRIVQTVTGINKIVMDDQQLSSGVYTIQLAGKSKVVSKLLLINK